MLTKERIDDAEHDVHSTYNADDGVVVVVDERAEGALDARSVHLDAHVRRPRHGRHQLAY